MKVSTKTAFVCDSACPTAPLEEVCTLITDGTHQTPTYSEEGTIFLSAKNVVGGTIDWDRVKRIPAWLHTELHGRLSPKRGDLLLAKNGTTGVAAIVDRDEVFDVYVSLALLRPGPKILPEYLWRVVNSPDVTKQFKGSLKGIGVPNLHLKDIRKATIPLPPLAEQKRIAGILDAADALRAKRRESLAQLDSLLQSTFVALFGDPVANPMGWDRCSLDQGCERIVDCPHSTPSWTTSGVICLRTSNLGYGEWDWTDTRYVTEEEYLIRTKRSEIAPGDLILSREGTVGVLAMVKKGMRICMGQRLVQVRPTRSHFDPQYLLHILLHDLSPSRLGNLMAGSTSKHLNVKDLKSLPIPIPPLPLQRRFAAIVESVERQKARQRAHLAELDALFAALQHRAFRGEL